MVLIKNKIVGIIYGQNCKSTIGLAIRSLKGIDKILFIDGGSTDGSLDAAKKEGVEILNYSWDSSRKYMPYIQKQRVLDYLKENYKDWWCIHIDSDEVIDNIDNLKKFISEIADDSLTVFDVKMRHFVYSLRTEDATTNIHMAPMRLFKVKDYLNYFEGEHVFFRQTNEFKVGQYTDSIIWHLAYCEGIWAVKKRYDGQMKRRDNKSHPISFLKHWKNAHIFGMFPVREINLKNIPKIILDEFDISGEELMIENKNEKPFTILFCKGWAPDKGDKDRCGFPTLLRAYSKAFMKEDNVRLLAKLNQAYIRPDIDLQQSLLNVGINLDTCPKLEIITQNIPFNELKDIYAQADVMCVPTKGEAFGLTFLEALSMGIPVISSDAGGMMDFLTPECSWILPTTPGPATEDSLFYEGCTWKYTDEEELSKLLHYLYHHRDEVRTKAKYATSVAKKWQWSNSAEKAMEALEKLN